MPYTLGASGRKELMWFGLGFRFWGHTLESPYLLKRAEARRHD